MADLTEEQAGIQRSMEREVHESLGKWINAYGPFSHFVTRTLGDDTDIGFTKPGIATARKCLVDLLRVSDATTLVGVLEWQVERRVPHVHALVNTAHDVDERWMNEWDYIRWGISRWLVYDANRGAAGYLGKYICKDMRGPDVEWYIWHKAEVDWQSATDRQLLEIGKL